MAVVHKSESWALLDHAAAVQAFHESQKGQTLIDKKPLETKSGPVCGSKRWRKELFAVHCSFMMDSQAEKIYKSDAMDAEDDKRLDGAPVKRKRRKKNIPLPQEDQKTVNLVQKLLPEIAAKSTELQVLVVEKTRTQDNNRAARAAAQISGCGDLFQNLCFQHEEGRMSCGKETILLRGDGVQLKSDILIGRCLANVNDYPIWMTVDNHSFLIPGHSSYLTSSFNHFISGAYKEIKVDRGYDLIVLDPPWMNKSVRRKKSYWVLEKPSLKQIPLRELAGESCLVCVWVTNNQNLISFVEKELFPHWHVQPLARWIWLKITQNGHPVSEINSHHKKPYEQILIGITKSPVTESVHNSSRGTHSGIPADFVISSVPCSLHSKKPPLQEVLAAYLPDHPLCLEMFARNLTPHWCSWGNEPLKHQHEDYFETVD